MQVLEDDLLDPKEVSKKLIQFIKQRPKANLSGNKKKKKLLVFSLFQDKKKKFFDELNTKNIIKNKQF